MFARHDLLWLTERGWLRVRARAAPECHMAIDAWRRAGWPAVARRSDADLPPGEVAIGLPLPPGHLDGARRRVACRVSVAEVRATAPALPLAQVIDSAPRHWRRALVALERHAAAERIGVRVFGSVAFQALTGLDYLTGASDIDVLLHPLTRAELDRGLSLLSLHARSLRIDGEIVFPNAKSVAWKELVGALAGPEGSRVIVKEMQGVSLQTASALLSALRAEPQCEGGRARAGRALA